VKPKKTKGATKTSRPKAKDLREACVLAFTEPDEAGNILIPNSPEGIGELSEQEINDLAETPEAYEATGMGVAFGDIPSRFAENVSEDTYEEKATKYRHAVILRAIAHQFFQNNDTMVKVAKGRGEAQTIEEVLWIDAKGKDPEDAEKNMANTKVLEVMIADWAAREAVEVEGKKGKTEKTEATLALKASGFLDDLTERIAEAQKETSGE